jgi:hypothetical protein
VLDHQAHPCLNIDSQYNLIVYHKIMVIENNFKEIYCESKYK